MTVWIKKEDNEIADDFIFSAYLGFKQKNRIIKFFTKPQKIYYKPNDVVIGDIQDTRYILSKLDIKLPNFYIPDEVKEFAGRKIEKSTILKIKSDKQLGQSFFIKPVITKQFPSQVVDNYPLITYCGQEIKNLWECWKSELVNFVSEYRIFIIEKEIVGCQYYLGDFSIFPDWAIIKECVEKIENQPKGWCLDFGITDSGKTLLIEANDGYAIGDYGLYSKIYSELLEKRWLELTSGE